MNEEQTTTGTQVDNSDLSIEERVSLALDEPTEEPVEPQEDEQEAVDEAEDNAPKEQDNTYDECPDKFKDKDGKVDVNKLAKSYKELEPLLQEKANWEKERAELLEAKKVLDKQREETERLAQEKGYASASDMEFDTALVNYEANEYAKYLHYTEDPEAVKKLLIDYINNPSGDILDEIELEFPSGVIKRVNVAKERQRVALESELNQQKEVQAMAGIEDVISQSVEYDQSVFNHKPFEELFVRTLQRYGNNFTFEDAQVLIGAVNEIKKSIRDEVIKEYGIKQENNKATDEIASFNPSSAPVAGQKSIRDLSGTELAKAISKLI